MWWRHYSQTSNLSGSLVGNKIVDHPDVVGASPVGAAPATSFSTFIPGFNGFGQRQLQDETRNIYKFGIWCGLRPEVWRLLVRPTFVWWKHYMCQRFPCVTVHNTPHLLFDCTLHAIALSSMLGVVYCANSYIEGLVQGCSNSSALAMELLQSCAKPTIFQYTNITCVKMTPLFTSFDQNFVNSTLIPR